MHQGIISSERITWWIQSADGLDYTLGNNASRFLIRSGALLSSTGSKFKAFTALCGKGDVDDEGSLSSPRLRGFVTGSKKLFRERFKGPSLATAQAVGASQGIEEGDLVDSKGFSTVGLSMGEARRREDAYLPLFQGSPYRSGAPLTDHARPSTSSDNSALTDPLGPAWLILTSLNSPPGTTPGATASSIAPMHAPYPPQPSSPPPHGLQALLQTPTHAQLQPQPQPQPLSDAALSIPKRVLSGFEGFSLVPKRRLLQAAGVWGVYIALRVSRSFVLKCSVADWCLLGAQVLSMSGFGAYFSVLSLREPQAHPLEVELPLLLPIRWVCKFRFLRCDLHSTFFRGLLVTC